MGKVKFVKTANGEKHIPAHRRRVKCSECERVLSGSHFRWIRNTPYRFCNGCMNGKGAIERAAGKIADALAEPQAEAQ